MKWHEGVYNIRTHEGFRLGVELEVEGDWPSARSSSLNDVGFIFETDDSLRSGGELKSYSPMEYELFVSSLQTLSRFIQEVGDDWQVSRRCSTHIHVNTTHMDAQQFKTFLWLAVACEPAIMHFCSETRNHSNFCVPIHKSLNLRSQWSEFLTSINKEHHPRPQLPKYAAIGGFRLHDLGTIEFRMFPGVSDVETLKWYVDVLKALHDEAMTGDIPTFINRKQTQGVMSLLSPLLVQGRDQETLTKLSKLIEVGIEMANDIIREPLTDSDIKGMYDSLFPSQFLPVTDDFVQDLYNLTQKEGSFAKALQSFDPDDVQAAKVRSLALYQQALLSGSNPFELAGIVDQLMRVN